MSALVEARPRFLEVDRVRGFAIACMVVDHLALFVGFDLLRLTVGRLALPLFFVVAGWGLSSLRRRHLDLFLVGLALPLVVPWIDAPNVLVWFVVCAVVLEGARRVGLPLEVVCLVCLGLLANGWGLALGTGYPAVALLALMALGRLCRVVDADELLFRLGAFLPRAFEWVGSRPASVYVGHLLVLEVVRRVVA